MSKELIERIVKEFANIYIDFHSTPADMPVEWLWANMADRAVQMVLEHFSEPSNVTDGMAKASLHALIDLVESEEDNERDKIAQAMRAARDEVSRG